MYRTLHRTLPYPTFEQFQVKAQLEALTEEVKVVASVSLSAAAYAPQRQMEMHPYNYLPGEPPSLVTLAAIDSQIPFSYCTPAIMEEVLVPPGCG